MTKSGSRSRLVGLCRLRENLLREFCAGYSRDARMGKWAKQTKDGEKDGVIDDIEAMGDRDESCGHNTRRVDPPHLSGVKVARLLLSSTSFLRNSAYRRYRYHTPATKSVTFSLRAVPQSQFITIQHNTCNAASCASCIFNGHLVVICSAQRPVTSAIDVVRASV